MADTATIVARLVANAQPFADQIDSAFAGLAGKAAAAGDRASSAFATNFSKIEQIAARTLDAASMGKGLDVGAAQAKQEAAAQEVKAQALRQVLIATEALAAKQGQLSEQQNRNLLQTRAEVTAAEQAARAARVQAESLDLLQNELNQQAGAAEVAARANRVLGQSADGVARGSRGMGGGLMMLGQQAQDFTIQVGSGTSVLTAFGQQFGQATFAMQGMGGALGKVGTFLQGPWGVALTLAVTGLALFGDKIFGATEKSKDLVAELIKEEEKTRAADTAKREYAKTVPGVIEAIRKQSDELRGLNKTLEDTIRLQEELAKKNLGQAKSTRFRTGLEYSRIEGEIAEYRQQIAIAYRNPNERTSATVANYNRLIQEAQARLQRLKGEYVALGRAVAEGEAAVREASTLDSDRKVDEALDAETGAAGRLRRELARLREERKAGRLSAGEYERQTQAARAASEAEIEEIRKRERKDRPASTASLGRGVAEANRAELSDAARRYSGVREGADSLTALFRQANVNIDPKITAWCAAFVNAVLATEGLPGTGQLNARSFLTYGQETNNPTRGDIVVLKRGDNAAQGHVGFFEGYDKKGNVRVLGGNQSDSVSTATFNKRDVLGFRRAPDEADIAKEQVKALEQQTELRDRILGQVEEQLNTSIETARYFGDQAAGLDDQAKAEREIAKLRRESADQLNELTKGMSEKDAAAYRAQQALVSDAFREQLGQLNQQGEAFADLLRLTGDRKTMTEAERATVQQVSDAYAAQLEAMKPLAKTLEERLLLEEAIARLNGKIPAAAQEGVQNAEDAKRNAEALEKANEAAWESWQEDQQRGIEDLADFYEDAFDSGGKSIWESFKREGKRALAMMAAQWTMSLINGQQAGMPNILQQIGATSGGGGGAMGFLSSLFGGGGGGGGNIAQVFGGGSRGGLEPVASGWGSGGGSWTNNAILSGGMGEGGAMGGGGLSGIMGSVGAAMPAFGAAVAVNQVIGDIFGFEGGPLGILTGPLKKLFGKKTKWGRAELSGFGDFSTEGNSGKREDAAMGAGQDVLDNLNRIMEALGASEGAFNVTIGMRGNDWRVNTDGGSLKKDKGAKDFDEDYEAALEYAIRDAIKDGALTGISAASKTLLTAGKDLERQLQKAVLIESIPKRLKAMTDPVGAAIDELNEKWKKTIDALKEGGATAEQTAEAQKLYKLELAEVQKATGSASADLKKFLEELNFGSSSPYSLRDQEGQALAALQPFLDQINAGQSIDSGAYQEAAGRYLEIERELYGSTARFFQEMDRIQAATGQAINTIDNAAPIRTISDPWIEATAANTAATNQLLTDIRDRLPATGGGGQSSNGVSFIGGNNGRGFGGMFVRALA